MFRVEALEERRLLAAVVPNSPGYDSVTYNITYHIPENSTLTTNALNGVLAFDPNNAANYSGSGAYADFATNGYYYSGSGNVGIPLGSLSGFVFPNVPPSVPIDGGDNPSGTLTTAGPTETDATGAAVTVSNLIDADGSFTYTPLQNFTGTVTFTAYAVSSENALAGATISSDATTITPNKKAPVTPPKGSLKPPTSPQWVTGLLAPDQVINVSIDVGDLEGSPSTSPTGPASPLPTISSEPASVDTNAFPTQFTAAARFPVGDTVTVQWLDGSSLTNAVTNPTPGTGVNGLYQASTAQFTSVSKDQSNQVIDTNQNTIAAVFTDKTTGLSITTAPAIIGIEELAGPEQGLVHSLFPLQGAQVTLTALAAGPADTTIQWEVGQYDTDTGFTSPFAPISGATSATFTFTAQPNPVAASTLEDSEGDVIENPGDGLENEYEAVFSDSTAADQTTSLDEASQSDPNLEDDALVDVQSPTPPVIITMQSMNQSALAGSIATFTATASGTPTPTVQWQSLAPGTHTFSPIPGATSATLSINPVTAAENNTYYEAVFTNSQGSATSNLAVLTVLAGIAPAITTQPTDQTATVGGTATFTAAAVGTPTPSIQWEVEIPGSANFVPISGATGTTFSINSANATQNGNEYEAVFTNKFAGSSSFNTTTTTFAKLTVGSNLEVTGVRVGSSSWSSSFPYTAGYPIPTGASQLTDLPWINLNQVSITFNQAATITQAALIVDGINQATYATSAFSYNSSTNTATWTFTKPIGDDKLALDLASTGANAVTSAAGTALDGEWTNGSSAFPSGNGQAGGDFVYDLNVLPGDVKQTGGPVNILGVIAVRNQQLTSPGGSGYSAFFDVDGSGSINILDVVDVRNRQLTSLPSGSPAIASAVSSNATADLRVAPADSAAVKPLVAAVKYSTMKYSRKHARTLHLPFYQSR